MKKQNFKFSVKKTKFGNAKIENVKAFSFEEAKSILFSKMTNYLLTRILLLKECESVVVTDFDFDYNGIFYKNYINQTK